MRVNTPNDLEDSIAESLAWRRTELLALKSALEKAGNGSPGSPLARALARSSVAMLYAHWEGFIRDACQCYVDYVARRRLKHAELSDGFLVTALLALSKKAEAGDEEGKAALVEAFRRPDSRAHIPKRAVVDTKSNLRYAVFRQILDAIGVPIDTFAPKDKLIDRVLCDGRNEIAHGRDYYCTVDDFAELHAEVLGMMEAVRDLIVSAVRLRSYRNDGVGFVAS